MPGIITLNEMNTNMVNRYNGFNDHNFCRFETVKFERRHFGNDQYIVNTHCRKCKYKNDWNNIELLYF